MFEIGKETEIEIIEKKSRFITRIFKIYSADQAKEILADIAKNEKGANHNCYAYRILKGESVIEKKSDDGEPGGTAGAPMLAVLNGENLINALAVTTRYFGGIKLGTGGLVSAYKKGVVEVIKVSGKKEYIVLIDVAIKIPINEVSHIEYLLNKADIDISNKEFGIDVIFTVSIPEKNVSDLDPIIKKVKGVIVS